MPDNRLLPLNKGKPISEAITLYIDDSATAFHGFENITVVENIDSIANPFSFDIPQKYQQVGSNFKIYPGAKVAIAVNKEKVLVGRVDRLQVDTSSSNKKISVSGRSLPADLVDCSVQGAMEYNNISLDSLAKKLVSPFGIKVFLSVVPG